jgi:hypothetical protein
MYGLDLAMLATSLGLNGTALAFLRRDGIAHSSKIGNSRAASGYGM